MQYMVTGMDGKEYGPTDLDTLKTWVTENRLAPHTVLRDFNTGQTMPASAVPGLFSPTTSPNVPPVGMAYPRAAMGQPAATRYRGRDTLGGVIARCVLALFLAVVLSGAGIVSGAYAVYYAVQCKQNGDRHGNLALGLAIGTLALVGVIYAVKLSLRHAAPL